MTKQMFEIAAQLGHEELITRVTDLAARVQDGDGSVADELVVSARVLQYRVDNRASVGKSPSARPTRLSELPVRGLAAQTRNSPAAMTMNLVGGRGALFVTTTAGHIRTVFSTDRLGTMSLATLPRDLSGMADASSVVLFETLNSEVSGVLLAIGNGDDPAEAIGLIVARVIHRRPRPWEPGGWNGD
jgi:hypothetical protein